MGKLSLRGRPSERQQEFFSSKTKFVAYGGARGGGKSWALRRKLTLMCIKYKGLSALLIRRSYPELRENHIRPLLAELHGIASYNETHKVFTFSNGSRIRLGYLETENDVQRYQGAEFDVIAIDEATQLSEYQFRALTACLRGTTGLPKRMYLTCNPGGIGHGWVKRLFIDKEYTGSERAEDYSFIQALVYDNKQLLKHNPDYVKQLEALPSEMRDAWLFGRWDIFSGQFFSEFDEDVHTAEFDLPENVVRYAAIDYGLDMLAVVFVAVDTEGKAYVYDEICEKDLIVSKAAACILEKVKGAKISAFIAPSDLWSRQKDSGKSISELFMENGIPFTRISGTRSEGWLSLKEWLKKEKDENGNVTSAMIIHRRCKNLISCLPRLIYDGKNPSDCSTKPHEITHITDALRYFAHSRVAIPKKQSPPKAQKLSEKLSKFKKII